MTVTGRTPADPAETTLRERLYQQRHLIVVIAVCEIVALITVSAINPHDHIDGEVYRLGARAWLDGRAIYQNLPPTESGMALPFIYPPFAAIVFSPLALVPKLVSTVIISITTHLALLATLYVVLSASTFMVAHRDKIVLVTAAILPLATVTEPVLETITYAQINVVLMALVAVDCLWRTRGPKKLPYPRGMLIGIAAGLKLTPLVFLLFLLLRRDGRSIAVALGTFAATILLGVVLAFENAGQFWFKQMLATSEVSFGKLTGDASTYAGNQSVRSMLSKWTVPEELLTVVWALAVLLILALAVAGMVQALRKSDLALALTLNAVAGLLISPVSWFHHWVWAIPALVLLIGGALVARNWATALAGSLAAALFTLAPHFKVPQGEGRELTWNVFTQFVGNAYVYLGLALLVYAAYQWWDARRTDQQVEPDPAAVEQPQA